MVNSYMTGRVLQKMRERGHDAYYNIYMGPMCRACGWCIYNGLERIPECPVIEGAIVEKKPLLLKPKESEAKAEDS